jgi:hypothetical protein
MPINLGDKIRSLEQNVYQSTIVDTLFRSTLSATLLIAGLVLLIIMVLYPAKPGTSGLVLIKMLVYIVMVTFVVLFIHGGIIKYHTKMVMIENDQNELIQSITNRDPVYAAPEPPKVVPQESKSGGYTSIVKGGNEVLNAPKPV